MLIFLVPLTARLKKIKVIHMSLVNDISVCVVLIFIF